jgi:hypothetical protein
MDEYIERRTGVSILRAKANMAVLMDAAPYFEKAAQILEKLPAADVAPVVHGRWISWEESGNFVPSPDRHECSVCHDAAQVLVNGFELLSDYCPSCGAKMDGGADNA